MVISGSCRGGDARTHIFPCLGFIKGFLRRFWRTHGFINLKTFVRTQNLAFVHTYTFRMKSTESFINETPVQQQALDLLNVYFSSILLQRSML